MRDLITGIYPAARVYAWNVLTHKLNEWPAWFETEAGGRHGWVIKQAALAAQWKGSGGRDRQVLSYDVLGFYDFRTGKDGDNSDDEFSVIREAVYDAFKGAPKLGLECIEEHGLLQWRQITTINCGEEVLHLAAGRIEIMHCC